MNKTNVLLLDRKKKLRMTMDGDFNASIEEVNRALPIGIFEQLKSAASAELSVISYTQIPLLILNTSMKQCVSKNIFLPQHPDFRVYVMK